MLGTRPTTPSDSLEPTPTLRRSFTLKDVVFFFVTTGTNLQWVAFAAAGGPGSLAVWGIGAVLMFAPLATCVVALSSLHPEEGGIYVWSRKAFGPFAGFMTGWMYWCSNLPYFPGLLYFTAGNALFLFGGEKLSKGAGPAYFVTVSFAGLVLAAFLNVRGLGVGKRFGNLAALSRWFVTILLVILGVVLCRTRGCATSLWGIGLFPTFSLKQALFWSSIAFAWTGPEAASLLGDEIEQPRSTVPRGLLLSAPLIAAIYIFGTWGVLASVPAAEVDPIHGVLQAISRAELALGTRGLTIAASVLVTLTSLGSLWAWLEAVARIPFVAGVDRYLPRSFARLHPKWGSPYVALLTQAGVTGFFVVLGQAGSTVKGAYEILLSLTLLVTFIPFLFVFASALRLAGGREGSPICPGWVVSIAACVGLATTVIALGLATIPPPEEPHKMLAYAKVLGGTALLLLAGIAVYSKGRKGWGD